MQRTPSIVELRLRPIGDRLRYWPGQYVMLRDTDAQVPARSYSIANAPRRDGEIVLILARAERGTTSGWVHEHVTPGDKAIISGPYGTFIGDPEEGGPVLCVAGGSGLAPILSLTDAALGRGYADPVTLLFSATTEDDVYHEGSITLWEERHDNFRFIRTLTNPTREDAEPPTGHVPDVCPTSSTISPTSRSSSPARRASSRPRPCGPRPRGQGRAHPHRELLHRLGPGRARRLAPVACRL